MARAALITRCLLQCYVRCVPGVFLEHFQDILSREPFCVEPGVHYKSDCSPYLNPRQRKQNQSIQHSPADLNGDNREQKDHYSMLYFINFHATLVILVICKTTRGGVSRNLSDDHALRRNKINTRGIIWNPPPPRFPKWLHMNTPHWTLRVKNLKKF